MGRTASCRAALGLLFGLGLSAPAHAQAPAASAPRLELPQVPSLRLSWPVAPLGFSFSQAEVGNYASGPLRLFRAESLWLHTPTLQVLTISSGERAFELDCSLTCQPIVRNGFDFEARLALPRFSAGVPSSYAYARASTYRTPMSGRAVGLISAGFGGTLNF